MSAPQPFHAQTRLGGIEVRTFLDDEGRWGAALQDPAYRVDVHAFGARDQGAAIAAVFRAAGEQIAALRALLILLLCASPRRAS